jgi:hypothetical protein
VYCTVTLDQSESDKFVSSNCNFSSVRVPGEKHYKPAAHVATSGDFCHRRQKSPLVSKPCTLGDKCAHLAMTGDFCCRLSHIYLTLIFNHPFQKEAVMRQYWGMIGAVLGAWLGQYCLLRGQEAVLSLHIYSHTCCAPPPFLGQCLGMIGAVSIMH